MVSKCDVYSIRGVIVLEIEIVSVIKVLSFYDRITLGDLRVSDPKFYS